MNAKKTARARGLSAADTSLAKATRITPEWSDTFMTLLRLYARKMEKMGLSFTGEDFRLWAYKRGLPVPHDARCTGRLFSIAMEEGIIRHWGFAPTVSSNGSPRRAYIRGAI